MSIVVCFGGPVRGICGQTRSGHVLESVSEPDKVCSLTGDPLVGH